MYTESCFAHLTSYGSESYALCSCGYALEIKKLEVLCSLFSKWMHQVMQNT